MDLEEWGQNTFDLKKLSQHMMMAKATGYICT